MVHDSRQRVPNIDQFLYQRPTGNYSLFHLLVKPTLNVVYQTYRCYVIVGRRSALMPALISVGFLGKRLFSDLDRNQTNLQFCHILVVSIVNDVPSVYSDKLNFACVLILTVSNVFVTGAVASHLMSMRRVVVSTVPAQRVSRYLGFVAFIIEASPLWTILSVFISSTSLLRYSWPIGAKQIWDICGVCDRIF
jgi:hypothetical protein